MKNLICLLALVMIVSGCITPNYSAGTPAWHGRRLQEIEDAYQDGEITKAEYIHLKNEADQVRATATANSDK